MPHALSTQCLNIWMQSGKYSNKPRWFVSTGPNIQMASRRQSMWMTNTKSFIQMSWHHLDTVYQLTLFSEDKECETS